MLHALLLHAAGWFKTEAKASATDIKDKDWASPHTLLLLALVGYILWVSKLILTADHLNLLVRVFVVYLPCHAVMFSVTRICQAWGPNCRTPVAPAVAPAVPAASPTPPAPASVPPAA